MTSPPSVKRPLLLGHRGARRYAPENTLAAFELALEHGCDGFELDVRLTADSQPLICHDPKLFGLTVEENAFELVRARAALKGASLCRLPDVLSRLANRAFLDIELKVPGLEEITIAALRQTPPQRGYFVSSNVPEVLARLPEKVRSAYERFQLCPGCGRIYWEGTHYERLRRLLEVSAQPDAQDH